MDMTKYILTIRNYSCIYFIMNMHLVYGQTPVQELGFLWGWKHTALSSLFSNNNNSEPSRTHILVQEQCWASVVKFLLVVFFHPSLLNAVNQFKSSDLHSLVCSHYRFQFLPHCKGENWKIGEYFQSSWLRK